MYRVEFEKILVKKLPKSLLLYGENSYLIEQYIAFYIQKLDAKESLMKLYYDNWDFDMAKGFLSQSSLFGGVNLLIVKNSKKIPKKELDLLISLANRDENNYFIYFFDGVATNAKTLQNSFSEKNNSLWVRLFEPTINEALKILEKKAKRLKLDIDNFALNHLLLIFNNNISLSANELDKLAILDRKITTKEIDRVVYSTSSMELEEFLYELFSKKEITQNLEKIIEMGEDSFALLRATQQFIYQLSLFHIYIKLNGNIDSSKILGYKLPKNIENRRGQFALKLNENLILEVSTYLLEMEIKLKETPIQQREALIYAVFIRLQNYLN